MFLVFVAVVVFILYVWFVKPELLIKAYLKIGIFMCGATVKHVTDRDGIRWEYLERGKPRSDNPTMLFIHGYSARKEDWSLIIAKLSSDQHVIMPDMVGHGNTDPVKLQNDIYNLFSEKLHQFVELVDLDTRPFHIVGLSMGGAITLHYSATYPKSVAGASIMCPAIKTPETSTLTQEVNQGKTSPLQDFSPEGTRRRLRMVANTRFPMAGQIIKGVTALNRDHQDFFKPLYEILRAPTTRQVGVEAAERITSPSQVIWGADDKMIHVSGAEVLQTKLPNMKSLHIIPDCGHAIMIDKPKEAAYILTEFHNKLK